MELIICAAILAYAAIKIASIIRQPPMSEDTLTRLSDAIEKDTAQRKEESFHQSWNNFRRVDGEKNGRSKPTT